MKLRCWVGAVLAVLANAACALETGAQQVQRYEQSLQNFRLGLVVNQTSVVGDQHLVDFLLARKLAVEKIFALEHGVRGNIENGGSISNGLDEKSGLPIISLYGGKYAPDADDIKDLDALIFDIQDVGVRFYTYISSLHYLMQACADFDVPLWVFDRPNPNGDQVAGPVLNPSFKSFVGVDPIPLLHGLTVGELARMINGEGWLSGEKRCELHVIPVAGYRKSQFYSLPIRPSPNLPNDLAVRLYPSLALFEGTNVSVGRGTDFPFQVLGHPADRQGAFSFTPGAKPGASENPKYKGLSLRGDDLRTGSLRQAFSVSYLVDWHRRLKRIGVPLFAHAPFFDKLAGSDQLRLAIEKGDSAETIEASWRADIEAFKVRRQPYLLYPEN